MSMPLYGSEAKDFIPEPEWPEEEDENKRIAEEAIPDLPEAPVSITIKGYYKGFSVLITKRKSETDPRQLDLIKQTIDGMAQKGFQPSWNTETNGKFKSGMEKFDEKMAQQDSCEHPQDQVEVKVSGPTAKNPNKPYRRCNVCGAFLGFIKA